LPRLFGTDGVRGVAGVDLTAELATSIAAAAVVELSDGASRPLVVVGRDPRPSGSWLQDAIVAGLTAAGADVALLGVIPTPAVARAVADGQPGGLGRPDFGVVISASHNPPADNGIKLFGAGGVKLAETVEAAIESHLGADIPGDGTGSVVADLSTNNEWYVDALLATLSSRLDGLRLVVDCANGAAAAVAERAYSRAGATVTVINDDLTGERINDGCGATHPDVVRKAVLETHADLGLAHDGDADRCIAVTATGEIVDGDGILAILSLDAHQNGGLRGGAIAATVMSNLGLTKALRSNGIDVATTAVGDRAVAERMRADGLSIGGEQSGHVILLDQATTGDGILTGLHLAQAVTRSGRSVADLAAVVRRLPQVLVNVRVADREQALAAAEAVTAEVTAEVGGEGRVLVRASGTEPLVRVMVEAESEDRARQLAERIAATLQ
jgi:phosphoglucosamine mutase